MINHLAISTLTALVCVLAALLLRRRSASLRHTILLIGVLRFAAYTPWLTAAGNELAKLVPAHSAPAPEVARAVHFARELLHPSLVTPLRAAITAPKAYSKVKDVAWWLWWAGATFGIGVWLGRLARPVGSIRDATFWERDVMLQAAGAVGIDEEVELRILPRAHVPGAQGWLSPSVLLPDELIDQLSDAEMQAVLSHELAHLRRRDPLTSGAVRAVRAVFWFHPLIWWMERALLTERETACDEMVLSSGARREDYVAGIAKVCTGLVTGGAAYAGITGANLARRIEHIRSADLPVPLSKMLRAVPVTLALAAVLLPMAGGLLRAQTPPPEDAIGLYREAELTRRSGDLNGALRLFRRAEEAGVRAAVLAQALILDGTGRPIEALREYDKVLADDPANPIALNNASYLLAEHGGSLDEALLFALRAHELAPDSAEIADTLGWVYFQRNMPNEAILAFRDSVLKDPNNSVFRRHMAMALDEKPNAPEWMRELKAVLHGDPTATDESRLEVLLEMIGK